LREAGVTVHVFQDTATPEKPDAVFPNNWFSTHRDGRIALYPMFSPSRRTERRQEVIESLRESYQVSEVVDYTSFEREGLYLEGTGSMVLDRISRVAYVSLSQRSSLPPLEKFCRDFDYEAVSFSSRSRDGRPIYHTNVMMCIGSEFALVGLDAIVDASQRRIVQERLETSGRTIVALDQSQIEEFAGNALELKGTSGNLLVLSSRAVAALTNEQRMVLERFLRLLPLSLPTIERAGGSARCMLADVHLPPRIS
ncbi:MAG TPA: arginine deiminase-related protein, partial [Chthoniobacterales bacterium]